MEYFTDELNYNSLKSEHVENFKATQAFLSHNEFICPIENGQPIIVKEQTNNRFLTSNKSFEYKSYLTIYEKESTYRAHVNYWKGATTDEEKPPLGDSYKKINLIELGRLIKDFNVDGVSYYLNSGNAHIESTSIFSAIQDNERKIFDIPTIKTMQSLHLHMMTCNAFNMWDSREWFTLAYAIDNIYKTCDELTRDYIFNQWKEMAHGDYEAQRNLAIAIHDEVLMSEMYTTQQFDIDELEYINKLGTRIRTVSEEIIDFGCIESTRVPQWFKDNFKQYAQYMKNLVHDKCLEIFRNAGLSPSDALLIYDLIYDKQKEVLLEIYCIEKSKKLRPYDNHLEFTTEESLIMFHSHDFQKRHEVLTKKIVQKFKDLSQ